MTKQHFFSFIVALFATVSSGFCQGTPIPTSTLPSSNISFTQNLKPFIIDDYVVAKSVKGGDCRFNPKISLNPIPMESYNITISDPSLKLNHFIALYFDDNDMLWHCRIEPSSVRYLQQDYNFINEKDISIIHPEIADNTNIFTLSGLNGVTLEIIGKPLLPSTAAPCQGIIDVFPNPTDGDIFVDIESDNFVLAKITVYDNFGNISQQISDISLSVGRNTQRIDLSAARAGLYRVVVEAGGRRQIIPVQKN